MMIWRLPVSSVADTAGSFEGRIQAAGAIRIAPSGQAVRQKGEVADRVGEVGGDGERVAGLAPGRPGGTQHQHVIDQSPTVA
jgi:hypothetical protein